jgi:glucose/arabinose dehydrogenase
LGPDGNIYVADGEGSGNPGAVVQVTPAGASKPYAGDYISYGMAFDGNGNLYISELSFGSVDKVTPNGTESIYASGLQNPRQVVVDPLGNLYVTVGSTVPLTIVKVASDGTTNTFSGVDEAFYWDTAGDLYTGNYDQGTITLTAPGGSSTTIAMGLTVPTPLGLDALGDLYVWQGGVVDTLSPSGTLTQVASVPDAFSVVVAVTPEPSFLMSVPLFMFITGSRRWRVRR